MMQERVPVTAWRRQAPAYNCTWRREIGGGAGGRASHGSAQLALTSKAARPTEARAEPRERALWSERQQCTGTITHTVGSD